MCYLQFLHIVQNIEHWATVNNLSSNHKPSKIRGNDFHRKAP